MLVGAANVSRCEHSSPVGTTETCTCLWAKRAPPPPSSSASSGMVFRLFLRHPQGAGESPLPDRFGCEIWEWFHPALGSGSMALGISGCCIPGVPWAGLAPGSGLPSCASLGKLLYLSELQRRHWWGSK